MWDSFVKNVGVLTAVATLVGSAIAFFVQRGDDIEQRAIAAQAAERASKKVFLDKQAELYFETVPLVSRLANAESAAAIVDEDRKRFWQIFWGELGMVEDVEVARAMDLFGKSLNAFEGSTSNPACADERLSISLTLSHCVRKSLGTNWGVDFRADNLDWCTEERFAELDAACTAGDAKQPVDPKRPTRAN